jgi:hypothetical protein
MIPNLTSTQTLLEVAHIWTKFECDGSFMGISKRSSPIKCGSFRTLFAILAQILGKVYIC